MPKCGASTRKGGKCQREALHGKRRCALHGGKSTGPVGHKNAAKPGSLYSAYMTPEEQAIASQLELGRVDEELRLTRIRLMRALKLEQERGGTAELDERIERDGAENVSARMEEKFKVRDYAGMIDRLTARIESLEARRAYLMGQEQERRMRELDLAEKERSASGLMGGVDFTVRRAGEELGDAPSN